MMVLLSVKDLCVGFDTDEGVVRAGNHIDLDIRAGSTIGLIGETGCGKSVLGQAILRVLPRRAALSGTIYYQGMDLLRLPPREMRRLRGREIALIPQNPASSLNPVLNVGRQVAEAVRLHQEASRREAWKKAAQLLKAFYFSRPEKILTAYPHQLSGGMKQRILAAMGLTGHPKLLIADEPTKGLDAVTQGHMIHMFKHLRRIYGSALMIITHNLKVAERLCDEVAVMYAGKIVEHGTRDAVLEHPKHPYTKGLIASLPDNGLQPIPGQSPALTDLPDGCHFAPRCALAEDECRKRYPRTRTIDGSRVSCRRAGQC